MEGGLYIMSKLKIIICLLPFACSILLVFPMVRTAHYNHINQSKYQKLKSELNIQKVNLKTLEDTRFELKKRIKNEKQKINEGLSIEKNISILSEEISIISEQIKEYEIKISKKKDQINKINKYLKNS